MPCFQTVNTLTPSVVGKLGFVIPWALGAAAISAVGSGLLSLFVPDTPTGEWIGFQIISGIGRGTAMQMVRYPKSSPFKPGVCGLTRRDD